MYSDDLQIGLYFDKTHSPVVNSFCILNTTALPSLHMGLKIFKGKIRPKKQIWRAKTKMLLILLMQKPTA